MIVGITDYVTPPFDIEERALGEVEFVFFDSEDENDFDAGELAHLDALLVWHAHLTPITFERLRNCKIVVRYGVGYDNVDLDAVRERGIPFCNTPDYGTEEVADTAAAMILNLQRRIAQHDFACRRFTSGWQEHVIAPLARTNECTLGVVGVGRIGTALMNRMKPFGYRLVGYDPYLPSGHEKAVGYERMNTLDALLAEADVVSLHCNLTDETAGMVNAAFFARLKPGALLVNTARGQLLADLGDLEAALRSGALAGAALDVLPEEPPSDNALLSDWRAFSPELAGRLIVNPHTAYYSESAWYEMRYKAAETARLYLDGNAPRNRVA